MEIEVYKVYKDLQVPMGLLVDQVPSVVLVFKVDQASPDHVDNEVIQASLVLMEIVDLLVGSFFMYILGSKNDVSFIRGHI